LNETGFSGSNKKNSCFSGKRTNWRTSQSSYQASIVWRVQKQSCCQQARIAGRRSL